MDLAEKRLTPARLAGFFTPGGIMAFEIEPCLGHEKPVFLYDYPAACGALAKLKTSDTSLAERFELYIRGLELCNAFANLGDDLGNRQGFAFTP